ncbi:hypothetical protein ASG92_20970 [Arthrobacter sp. Soil736]|uniref:hypothetical protein n=1 Tax=Arthrobacter sp. Soil736 TaxID=1736395 RepID=UPI00070127E5|nr:hypothetical protein [Arthrobacter sp. Soil736]KRE61464.1 hypothetical protein ASG92_20970 [Arthrobacter sp. Soil736]
MSNGAENITAKRDGFVHGGDSNGFYCGWVHNATPRTIAGVDARGRTLLVVSGQVVNSPSDTAGQRPVGDALLVLPRRRN